MESITGKVDTTQSYRLSDRLLLKDHGENVLAFDPDSLTVHQFNPTLAHVAKACDGSVSCEEIVVQFVDRYDLNFRDASREVYRALKLLTEHDLLEAA